MSATTFVTAYTTAIPQHPGRIPSDSARVAAWVDALDAREALVRSSEVSRKFHGTASDKTILAWAARVGAVGQVMVTVIDHNGRTAFVRSSRVLER